jgi:hypothetical protein
MEGENPAAPPGSQETRSAPGIPPHNAAVRALVLASVAAAALGAAVAVGVRPAGAVGGPSVLYVSGLHVDGASPTALITLTNTSSASADFYSLTYSVFHADGHAAAPPTEVALPLLRGRSVTIDIATRIAAYRASQGVSPFVGPIQVVIRGTSCADTGTCPEGVVPQPFGPEVIQVDARQTEGSVTYDASWTWSAVN